MWEGVVSTLLFHKGEPGRGIFVLLLLLFFVFFYYYSLREVGAACLNLGLLFSERERERERRFITRIKVGRNERRRELAPASFLFLLLLPPFPGCINQQVLESSWGPKKLFSFSPSTNYAAVWKAFLISLAAILIASIARWGGVLVVKMMQRFPIEECSCLSTYLLLRFSILHFHTEPSGRS